MLTQDPAAGQSAAALRMICGIAIPDHPPMPDHSAEADARKSRRVHRLAWYALIACMLLGAGWYWYREYEQQPLRPDAPWSTNTSGWNLPMPDRVRSAGIAADDIRFEQNGKDLRIAFRNLAIEKHPSAPEVRIVALALRIDPPAGHMAPQAMEGVLTGHRPVLTRTTVVFTVPGAVNCLKSAGCTIWLELTVREPGLPQQVEHSRRMPVPGRPVV